MSEYFEDLVQLIRTLRGPNGCPWDKKQDLQSVKQYILEEAYELIDAVTSGDHNAILEEAGDLLFQILFLIELEQEAGYFTIQQVINNTKAKMIRRHPHVFGDTKVNSISDVLQNWEKIKKDEKAMKNNSEPLIPVSMPGSQRLLKAFKLAQKRGLNLHSLLKDEYLNDLKQKITGSDIELCDTGELKSFLFFITLYSWFRGLDIDKSLKELSDVILAHLTHQDVSKPNLPDAV